MQGGPEKYPSKNSNENNTKRRMKKCFYKVFQKYSQNIMNWLNFELTAFCFDDESETGFHWCAWTSHYFFNQLGPSWLNDYLQAVQIGLVISWNITLQRDLIAKSMRLVSGFEGVHICLSWNPPDSVQLRLTDIQGLKDRCVSWSIVLYEDLFVLKSFCNPRKKFFCNMFK